MKLQITFATVLAILSASAVAQDSLPACSLQCIQSAMAATQCNVQDVDCICASGTIVNDTSKCVGSCDPTERERAMAFVQAQLCPPTQVPEASTAATEGSASPTDTPEVLRRQDSSAPTSTSILTSTSTDTPTDPAPTTAAPADSAPTSQPTAVVSIIYEIPVDSAPTDSGPIDPTPVDAPIPDPET